MQLYTAETRYFYFMFSPSFCFNNKLGKLILNGLMTHTNCRFRQVKKRKKYLKVLIS